jgi:hypothetical protein
VEFFEDFCADPFAVMRRCLNFLGANVAAAPTNICSHTNVSEGKRLLDPRFDLFREYPAVRVLKRLLPARLKYEVTRRLFVRTHWSGRPAWDPACKEAVIASLAEPTRKFLADQGRNPAMWNLAN